MTKVGLGITAAALIMFAFAGQAFGQTGSQDMDAASMRVFGRTLPPIGHVDFCRRYPRECLPETSGGERFELTPARWRELNEVNDLVNKMIEPATDWEVYGRLEHWEYPNGGRGDCEDYALLKQKLLMERGWPRGALLITVVRDEVDEGHAILTARTAKGDFLLDNKHAEIVAWNDSPYVFVKRQSASDPRIWMALSAPEAPPAALVSGPGRH